MDNLTHSLVGWTMARAGIDRGAAGAAVLVVVGANLPDLDVITAFGGWLTYFQYHRGWSHSLAMAPLLALLPLPLWWWFARKQRPDWKAWAGAWLACFAGILSHLFLDCWNSYGIRLAIPFSYEWFQLDWVFVVDLWIWFLLLPAALGPVLARLVYSEIGARKGSGRGGAALTLALLVAFLAARAGLHSMALGAMESRLYEGHAPIHVAALPGPFVPWRWTGVVETEHTWLLIPVDLGQDFDPESGRRLHRPEIELPAANAVRNSPTGRVFLAATRFPCWRVLPSRNADGGTSIRITDLRFGSPEEARYGASFELDASGRVVKEKFGPISDLER